MSSSTSVALGPTDFNERDTTDFGRLRHAAHMLYEVTKQRGPRWPNFQVVDVAVQGLLQPEDELRHTAISPLKGLQNSSNRRYAITGALALPEPVSRRAADRSSARTMMKIQKVSECRM